jgi:hypothetical protein
LRPLQSRTTCFWQRVPSCPHACRSPFFYVFPISTTTRCSSAAARVDQSGKGHSRPPELPLSSLGGGTEPTSLVPDRLQLARSPPVLFNRGPCFRPHNGPLDTRNRAAVALHLTIFSRRSRRRPVRGKEGNLILRKRKFLQPACFVEAPLTIRTVPRLVTSVGIDVVDDVERAHRHQQKESSLAASVLLTAQRAKLDRKALGAEALRRRRGSSIYRSRRLSAAGYRPAS